MPLTHVCIWSKNGWKRISIGEASRMHPYGSVSAKSGLFMCELCGQFVTMTQANIRDSYFKHSSYEDEKNCPERSFGSSGWESTYNTLHLDTRGMPIKLALYGNSFKIQIGFSVLPEHLLDRTNTICIFSSNGERKRYSFERLNATGMTYLDAGSSVSPRYRLEIAKNAPEIRKSWQVDFKGILGDCLFDSSNGRKLATDADVQINETYYALTRRHFTSNLSSVSMRKVASSGSWSVYEIKATKLDEKSARFFLEYFHCRLTDVPIGMTFVWPLSVETPYLIYHKPGKVYTYVRGNASFKLFPNAYQSSQILEQGKLLPVACNDRQQMLAIERTVNILDYTYLWEDELDLGVDCETINVTDIKGNEVVSGAGEKVPEKNHIEFVPRYDGCFEVIKDGWVIFRTGIHAGTQFRFDKVDNGLTYKIYRGKDCIWEFNTRFIKKKTAVSYRDDDSTLLSKLNLCSGIEVSIGHAYGSIAGRMAGYPKVKAWLSTQIRRGKIPLEAKNLLERQFK